MFYFIRRKLSTMKAKPILMLLLLMLIRVTTHSQWSDNPALNTAIVLANGEQTIPKIATTEEGITYVSWFSNEGGNYNVRLQKLDVYGYSQWDAAGLLVSSNQSMTWLTDYDMCVDHTGGAVIVFQDIRTGSNNIYAYRISPEGAFTWGNNGIPLSNSSAFDAAPKVVVTPAGNAIVAWQADEVIIRQKISPSGSLLWGASGITMSGSPTYSWPQLMPAGNDSVIMKFFEDTGPSYSPTRHVYAQKYDVNGIAVWGSDAVISTAGGISAWTQIFPIVNDGSDGFYIAWHDDRDNNMLSSVFVQHITHTGQTGFVPNGVEASTQAGRNHFYPELAKVPADDNIYVYWNEMDADQNNRGIYGQKITSAGSKQWGNNGKTFIEISSTNVYPLAARNSNDDMIVIFEEGFNSTESAIKAMRIDVSGNFLWAGSFKTMCSVQSEKLHAMANHFNYGQWIAVWGDNRGSSNDIYGQNIQVDGTLGPIPEILQAGFTASSTQLCTGDEVTFTDLSAGDIITWTWAFEGGTPASSILQNPVVTYNNTGQFDVQLIVTSATSSDTLLEENYIIVREIPGQANTPSGETSACQGNEYLYSTNPVNFSTSYLWEFSPAGAGEISGNGTTALFSPSETYTGLYSLKVKAINNCGEGEWSGTLGCNLHESPLAFEMSDGGSYCSGSGGLEILVYGSQTNVDYILFFEGVTTGDTLGGTGDTISFGWYTEEGMYSSKAYNGSCFTDMTGEPYIAIMEPPGQAATPAGPDEVCNNDSTAYTTNGSLNATSYIWELTPPESGILYPGYLDAGVLWDIDYSGEAYISVTGVNECGQGNASDEFHISVSQSPVPQITGQQMVCDGDNMVYTTPFVEFNTYAWVVEGGIIINGSSTHEITVHWNIIGDGFVQVAETNPVNCSDTTAPFNVYIDDCIGIHHAGRPEITLVSNPASTIIEISVTAGYGQHFDVSVFSLTGERIINNRFSGQNCTIDVSRLTAGPYLVQIVPELRPFVCNKIIIRE